MSLSDRERLKPIYAQLEAAGQSVFLDLCEMLLMFSETMPHGMIKWDHPRVTVHVREKARAKKVKRDG